jgi:hypothetical protein
MSRLYTFGCSFTSYAWPTWADFFGLEFDEFENWGIPGIGNVAIANRVAECCLKNNINENDTVVVQWSSHLRNDYHLFRPPLNRDTDFNWKTKGSIFSYTNKSLYDKKWVENFFDEESYIMLSLNAMYSIINLLENKKCKWRMTTISDFSKLGNDYINSENFGEDSNLSNLWNKEIFSPYKKIFNHKNWLEPIGTYCWKQKELLYKWKEWQDPHPSPGLCIDWLYNILKPSLNLDNTKLKPEQTKWYYKCQEIKDNVDNLQMYGDILYKELENFDKTYRGY